MPEQMVSPCTWPLWVSAMPLVQYLTKWVVMLKPISIPNPVISYINNVYSQLKGFPKLDNGPISNRMWCLPGWYLIPNDFPHCLQPCCPIYQQREGIRFLYEIPSPIFSWPAPCERLHPSGMEWALIRRTPWLVLLLSLRTPPLAWPQSSTPMAALNL